MTEIERRDPEPSPLIERLLRRRTEPIGIIDVRHPQARYARIAGWVAARFPLLAELAERYGLGGEDEAGAAELIHTARLVTRSRDQGIRGPGTPAAQRSGPGPSQPLPSISPPSPGYGESVGAVPGRTNSLDPRLPATGLTQVDAAAHPFFSEAKLQGNIPFGQPPSREKEPLATTPVQPPLSPAVERFKASSLRRDKPKGSASTGENTSEIVSSPASLEVKPATTGWRVRRAAPGSMTDLYPELTHAPGQAVDSSPFPPAKPIRARIQRKPPDINLLPGRGEAQGGGRETPTPLDSLSVSPSVRGRMHESSLPQLAPVLKGSVQSPSLPRYPSTATAAAVADSRPHGGEPSPPSMPKDMHAVPLVWRRTPTANPDRALATEDSWARRSVITSRAPSQDRLGIRPRGGITEYPPVSQTTGPVPERPRPRFTKREWAELIERLSRLIWHKLAVDLDRRGVRPWR